MDALMLARLQFATTVGLHWLFVLFTLGLAPLVAVLHTRFALTSNPVFEHMTRFWGQLYVINYVLGIVTGLVMEFQFGCRPRRSGSCSASPRRASAPT